MLSLMIAAALQAAAPSAAPQSIVTTPDWVRRPTGDDIGRVYPNEALKRGLAGRVAISCQVTAEGELTGCQVVEESPVDLGFGEAALKLAPLFRMRPMTVDGKPVSGGTVRIPMRLTVDGRQDHLSALYACYGETAAAAERDPANVEAGRAFGFFAAQVGMRVAESKFTPQALEGGLTAARTAALAPNGSPKPAPSLAACLKAVPKPK